MPDANPCSIAPCDRRIHARGLCELHYRRVTRTGSAGDALPTRENRRELTGTPLQRFWSSIEINDEGCWMWTAGTSMGYGELQVDGRTVRAHRWSYEQFVGEVPPRFHVDHLCHNADPTCPGGHCHHRRCCNPAHFEAVSSVENLRRGRERVKAAKGAA